MNAARRKTESSFSVVMLVGNFIASLNYMQLLILGGDLSCRCGAYPHACAERPAELNALLRARMWDRLAEIVER